MALTSRMSSRLPYLALVLLTGAAVAPFLLLSYYNHPFMDDYYNAANVRTTGLWAQQIELYLRWTGRFSSSLLVTAANPIIYGWYEGFRWTPALTLLATLGTLYLGLRTLSQQRLPRAQAALAAAIFLLFYLHMIPEPYSAIYWFTGSIVYHVAGLALLLVFIASERARWATQTWQRRRWQAGAAICAVMAAAANEMTLLHLLLGLALVLGVKGYRRQWPQMRWWSTLLLLTLVVAVVTVVAPGNYVRMQFEGYAKEQGRANLVRQVLTAVPGVPGAMARLLVRRGLALKLVLPTLLWLPTILHWQRRGWLGTSIRLPWAWGAFFMLASYALSMLLFLGVMRQMPPDRAINGLLLFLFPTALLVIWAALAQRPAAVAWQLPAWLWRWGPVVYVGVFSLLGIPRRAWQELLLSAPAYDQQLLAREAQLRAAWSQGVEHVVVKPILGVKPYRVLITEWELTTEPGHYINSETALYFDVKSIVIDKQLIPQANPGFHYY
ncbi:hypothetical protein SAMN00120144_2047 [Hymenobacter roseosalivarius DSM 11622]|uniref:Glycosyltransferase RgtA/B/C/D-like domain-containing protein n=1 Tax=Hymenobacter roseosalivarius DSM 11622 TaxID=645990 RepID=A0A1W1VMQ9_9BACT|nr:DUF6056 family protein [Hymenobacter roseosalivarius]SMB94647.1 hypothetical protein SAMN00120144_2047 [Hymenobacter roseosalivarius DSM 11622]